MITAGAFSTCDTSPHRELAVGSAAPVHKAWHNTHRQNDQLPFVKSQPPSGPRQCGVLAKPPMTFASATHVPRRQRQDEPGERAGGAAAGGRARRAGRGGARQRPRAPEEFPAHDQLRHAGLALCSPQRYLAWPLRAKASMALFMLVLIMLAPVPLDESHSCHAIWTAGRFGSAWSRLVGPISGHWPALEYESMTHGSSHADQDGRRTTCCCTA